MARPLGNWMVRTPNMRGIMVSIIRFMDSCLGSPVVTVIIFCCIHMVPPTSTGRRKGLGSGRARSSHRN